MRLYQLSLSLLACGLVLGCNNSSSPNQFRTYNELLTEEQGESGQQPANATSDTVSTADSANSDRASTNPKDVAAASMDGQQVAAIATAPASAPSAQSPLLGNEETAEIPASAIAPLNIVDGSSTSDILKVAEGASRKDSPADSSATVASSEMAIPIAKPIPGGIRLLVPNKEFRAEGPQSALRVSYDDLDLLKVLNMEPVPADAPDHFPAWLAELNGQPVRIRGFMYPTFESTGIEQFVLARDNQICCFGRDPKVYDLIAVTLKPNALTDYIPNRPFDVVGTFRIDMLAEGGKPLGLYWLENAQVIKQ